MSHAIARRFFLAAVTTAVSALLLGAAPVPEPATPQNPAPDPAQNLPLEVEKPRKDESHRHESFDNVIVHFGGDAHLDTGRRAEAVVAIGGSASSDGEVTDGVVSIVGNTRVTGPAETAVAVFGDTYVDGEIGDAAVAVFGNVELGPHAIVHGDVAAVGGTIKRDPAAVVHGSNHEVSFPIDIGRLEWLHPWLKHCLLLGRPLALEPGIGWAWTLAWGFLALYVFIALLFTSSVEKCVTTLETRPGHSMLASLLSIFVTPLLTVMLALTVVGAVLIPFAWIALFCAGLFGKVVVLAALGRRLTRFVTGPLSHIAFPVFVGGLILIALYLVPFLGFILYKLTNVIGVGVVMYTLLLAFKAYRDQNAPPPLMAAAAGGSTVAIAGETVGGGTSFTSESTEAPPPAAPILSTLPRAGFWIRMAALFVDVLIVGIALGTVRDSDALLPVLAAYGAVMWKLKGTTIGGILCSLQVVRVDDREFDWPTSVVRALACFLSLTVVGLGFLWIAFDRNKQGWHDKIAGTAVVRVPRGLSLV